MENQESRTVAIWKKVAIGIVAFIGFLTTIKLAIIYYNANFVPNAPASFCSINKFIDCDSVAKTVDSQFLGVPLAFCAVFSKRISKQISQRFPRSGSSSKPTTFLK